MHYRCANPALRVQRYEKIRIFVAQYRLKVKKFLEKYGAYIVAAVVFVALTVVYLLPSLNGKVLRQSDTMQWEGMSHTLREYNKTVDTPSNWTNSMFGGMPAYQITTATPHDGVSGVINAVDQFFRHLATLFFSDEFALLLGYFIGFFIMMRAFGIDKWLSIVGSIAVAMSSYFFLIIPAGHETKALTLGMMASVVGGFYLIFRKRYAIGASLVMFYSSIGMMRHPQMSFYLFMMMGVFGIAEIVIHIREKRLKDLGVSLAVFVLAIGVGVGTSYSTLKSNSEYVKETTRGGHSDLVAEGESKEKGLDIEYATAWSYGIDETITLLIPNYMGGSSNYNVGKDSKVYDSLVRHGIPASSASSLVSSLPTYWGSQPFTAGPVYVGAIVCFLFLLGCMIVKGPYKWALMAATLLSILLSWGHNFMPFTELFFNYFPFYNKFRTVSSILIVAQITMPLLGFLALKTIIDSPERKIYRKPLLISAGVTGGICLMFALFGGVLCTFSSPYDGSSLAGMPEWFMDALYAERASMLRSDAFRSFAFIALAAALLYLFIEKKVKYSVSVLALGLLVTVDMWGVDKRFFGDGDWTSARQEKAYFEKTDYEKEILADSGYFRVFNLTTNAFNESRTSYYLNSLGGYHAAKLRRYQDLIDEHLSKGHPAVVNMLNAKYIIAQGEDGRPQAMLNPDAMGNAWFVNKVFVAENARDECDALTKLDLHKQAVCDQEFASFVMPASESAESGDITLTSYSPDRLVYETKLNGGDATAVFSEIYYPYGWNAYIDGQKADHFRVNYTLRALNVPEGEHEVVFEFRPDSIYKGYKVNAAFKALMYVFILLCAADFVSRRRGNGRGLFRRKGAK